MRVSAARSCDKTATGRPPMAPCAVTPSPLVHRASFGAGVHAEVDVLAPQRWNAVSLVSGVDDPDPLLRAMLGARTAETLRAEGAVERAEPADPRAAAPWLRMALVDALDRWLHADVDQPLVDAERGVTRARAAKTLPPGDVRSALLGEALWLARGASSDLVALLRRLRRLPGPVPGGLLSALNGLVDGYRELTAEVAGPDHDLAAVVDGWHRLMHRTAAAGRPPPSRAAPTAPPADEAASSMIDPRQVRARLLGLSPDPAVAEISLSALPDDPKSVLVRVPAFRPTADADLMARLIDQRTGEVKGHALATRPGIAHFEARVPLCGLGASGVRADFFDSSSDVPPARSDTDSALREARRTVVLLAELRGLIALAQLPSAVSPPAHRLRDLASKLRGDGPFAIMDGAAGLLVAELASAFIHPA